MMKTGVCFILFVLLPLNGLTSVAFKPNGHERPKIARYNMRIEEKGTVFNEKVEIDEAKQTVTFKVPAHNSAEEIQVLNDFKMNLTMIRSHIQKICYLIPLDSNIPSPKKLKEYMDKTSTTPSVNNDKKLQKRKATFSVTKEVKDRTVLSNELASFCAKYPIFRLHVVPDTTVTNIMITKTAEKSEMLSTREKRNVNPRFRRQSSICTNPMLETNPYVKRCSGGMCQKEAENTCRFPTVPALHCRNKRKYCIFSRRCKWTSPDGGNCDVKNSMNCINDCFRVHYFFYLRCCEYRCS